MRVLILWSDNRSANLGVRALAHGTASLARMAWGPDIQVDFQGLGAGPDGFSLSRGLIRRDIVLGRFGPIKRWLKSYDVILDTGAGDSFTDIYGQRRLARMLYTQRTALRLGIPLILTPQTIGPFESAWGRRGAVHTLKRADLVCVRDSLSAASASQLSRPAHVVSTDVVFAIAKPPIVERRDVLVNVSGLLWEPNDHVNHDRYRGFVHELVRRLIDAGREVTFVAHVIDNHTVDNDVPAVSQLHREYASRGAQLIVPSSLDDVRRVLGSARVVVGSRMHACLNALSVGTPSIAWAYSRKFAPLLADLGWAHCIDLREDTTPVEKTMAIINGLDSGLLAKAAAGIADSAARRLHGTVDALITTVPTRGSHVDLEATVLRRRG